MKYLQSIKAFTLIEVMVVVAIIAILASMIVPVFFCKPTKRTATYNTTQASTYSPQAVQAQAQQKFCQYCGHSLP